MIVFQNSLWGYQLTCPDGWVFQSKDQVDMFAAAPEALDPDYDGPASGQILVRAEWNPFGHPIEPIWNRQVGMMAGWLGAKKVGTAPWQMGGGVGLEAEIQLAQKDQRRLWSGVLERKNVVLNFVVVHLKAERAAFEPLASAVIASLQFPSELAEVEVGAEGLPLPPGYVSVPAQDFIDDIARPEDWRAYDGAAGSDALQAFYWREAPHFGWKIIEYLPYPGIAELGFARFLLEKDSRRITLGVLPYREDPESSITRGRLALKLG